MMNKFKFQNPKNVNLSVYPPYLDKRFIEIIKNRKTPFNNKYINIMYAGGYSKEKGIYDLIEVFEKAKIKNFILNIYGYFPEDIKKNYFNNKSIIFHGYVGQKELFISYANNDIVVNPHRVILENNYIFPYKNIEIFSSGALPLVSKQAIIGFDSIKIKDLCTYNDLNELRDKLVNASKLWRKNYIRFESSYKLCLENYSEEKIFKNIKDILKY